MASVDVMKTDIFLGADMAPTSSGDLQTISGIANLQLALFHRLITVPGSLMYWPTYGVGIKTYQNAPSSFTLQQRLAVLIQDQFAQDPRVQSVTGVSFTAADDSPEQTIITVSLVPVGYTAQTFIFNPFGGL